MFTCLPAHASFIQTTVLRSPIVITGHLLDILLLYFITKCSHM